MADEYTYEIVATSKTRHKVLPFKYKKAAEDRFALMQITHARLYEIISLRAVVFETEAGREMALLGQWERGKGITYPAQKKEERHPALQRIIDAYRYSTDEDSLFDAVSEYVKAVDRGDT